MGGASSRKRYITAVEAAVYLGMDVERVYSLMKEGKLEWVKSASGQYKFSLESVERVRLLAKNHSSSERIGERNEILVNGTTQIIYCKDSRDMSDIRDNSVHLVVTSPPYFNAKIYSSKPMEGDLGNLDDFERWLSEIKKVWAEVFHVLQPGRKAFINIMNLPIRTENGFRSLNLVGRTIDSLEELGFVFKREIVWQKTNSVRAHFGTYPYPGGILINYSHEFILEVEKPAPKSYKKYAHVPKERKEASKLDKEFWLSIKKSDVWVMAPEKSGTGRNHPSPFPYELPYRLIRAYSYIGETILDPFLGSGTTLVAARDLKRNGIGYEINPHIAKKAIERVSQVKEESTDG